MRCFESIQKNDGGIESLTKNKFIMTISIFCLICAALFFLALGAFAAFVIFKLRKIDSQTDSTFKHYWGMTVYMDDIPQVGQSTERIGSLIVQIYEGCYYSELPVPRKGEEMSGIYYIGEHKAEIVGTVERVYYNTDKDWIVVRCKCTNIRI